MLLAFTQDQRSGTQWRRAAPLSPHAPGAGEHSISPFALSTLHILNFKLPVKISPQPQPLQDSFLHS